MILVIVLVLILVLIANFSVLWPFALALLIFIIFGVILSTGDIRESKQIQQNINSGTFLYYKDFESRWIVTNGRKSGQNPVGYKYQDGPGCYVIVVHGSPVTTGDYRNYENIYIGQSVNVCQRVHNHFNGKGNGDIYADIRNGKWVYVQFIKCSPEEMNSTEKKLIAAFSATSSYNKTRGGAMRRK